MELEERIEKLQQGIQNVGERLEKFNPNHVPSGPKGGQFAPGRGSAGGTVSYTPPSEASRLPPKIISQLKPDALDRLKTWKRSGPEGTERSITLIKPMRDGGVRSFRVELKQVDSTKNMEERDIIAAEVQHPLRLFVRRLMMQKVNPTTCGWTAAERFSRSLFSYN